MKYIVTATNANEKIRNTHEVPELNMAILLYLETYKSNFFPNIVLCDNETGEVLMHTRENDTPWVAEAIMDDLIGAFVDDNPILAMVALMETLAECEE